MRNHRFMTLLVSLLVFAVSDSTPRTFAQVEVFPNTITGEVRFSNVNPAVLDLLNPPNMEGMSQLYVSASSPPPASRSAGSDFLPTSSHTGTSYEITVDSDSSGISYDVTPRVSMLDGQQTYYFQSSKSAPVVAFMAGPVLDFSECLGVLTVRFVTAGGVPITVDNLSLSASYSDGSSGSTYFYSNPGSFTEQRFYVRGDSPAQISITVSRGASTFSDRIQYQEIRNVTVACDDSATLDVVVPDAGLLGQATGKVDLLREFELTVDGYDPGDYSDPTSVVARYGPFGNVRYARVPGVNFTVPSSGSFTLSNLMPSTLDPASPGYVVSAEMYVRTNEAIAYFRTPGLGAGSNPPMAVLPGESINLGDVFVIDPGYLRGRVFLQGPAESLGRVSLLRGLDFASNHATDGIPDALGIYGIYYSSVAANGVDRKPAGATLTSSYGYGSTGFKGSFDATASAYEGHYEMPLGGLNSERSLWNRDGLSVYGYSGTVANDDDYYYYAFSVAEKEAEDLEIVPGQVTTKDVAYCLSEVRLAFNSTEPFYNPNIRFSRGEFQNIDFQGQPANYSVYVDPVYGVPNVQPKASTTGHIVMYLPQGSYHLTPYITPAESSFASVSGDPIDLTIGCGQRIALDACLQMILDIPGCHNSNELSLVGSVATRCGNEVSEISYQLDDLAPVTVCINCGASPDFSFTVVNIAEDDSTLTVSARDDRGIISSVSGRIRYDNVPPEIQCPADVVVQAKDPGGAEVEFSLSASSDAILTCEPPSGTVFPVGTTPVTCRASDLCGNATTCSFTVTVQPFDCQLCGRQRPGDENQDGRLDISDPVAVLNHLFIGTNPTLPCGDGTASDPANLALLDANGDGRLDISDSVWILQFLFTGGPKLANCLGPAGGVIGSVCPCFRIKDCPDNPHGLCP